MNRLEEDETTGSDQTTRHRDGRREPTPPEVIRMTWDFIRKPENANAIVAVFTALIFLTGLIYTIFAGLQWRAIRESNEINREALESVQRAYVTFSPFITQVIRSRTNGSPPVAWRFQIPVVNSGTTPTRDMLNYATLYITEGELPADFDFQDFEHGRSMVLGPKAEINFETSEAGIDSIADVANGKKSLYLYGWATYRDIFKNTQRHVTKFCYRVEVRTADPLHDLSPNARYTIYGKHNCTDEECDKAEAK
jgi:hypothetical protein